MSLFNLNPEKSMDFLSENKGPSDGIYRPTLDKALNKRDGYKAIIRFLPNVIDEQGNTGDSAITRIMTYVKLDDPKNKSLNGFYDSPKNFNEQCYLTDTYFALDGSNNPALKERANCLNKVTRYYSYVLIVEDKNQPELEGKIMVYQYGWKIRGKINSEWNAENPERAKCNVFDLANGKDFELKIVENAGYPNYDSSIFLQRSPLTIKGKNMPTEEVGGVLTIAPSVQEKVLKFYLAKEVNITDFLPKRLTDAEKDKISKIIAVLTGEESAGMFESGQVEENSDLSADDLFNDTDTSSDLTDDFAEAASTTTSEELTNDVFDTADVELDEEDPFADM